MLMKLYFSARRCLHLAEPVMASHPFIPTDALDVRGSTQKPQLPDSETVKLVNRVLLIAVPNCDRWATVEVS